MSAGRFRIGLDEAGYGPRLGPLVVGLVRTGGGGGERLGRLLRRPAKHLPAVRDSKRLYQGDLAPLETVALAAVACARGTPPRTVGALLGTVPPGLDAHPWYAALDAPLPLAADAEAVAAAADRLARRLEQAEVVLERAAARPVLEGELNRRLVETGNKAAVELAVLEELLEEGLPGGRSGSVLCDRLGGRRRYGDWLCAQLPFWQLEIEAERPARSAYRLRRGRVELAFRFLVGGEDREPEIALASCLAKYVREVMMALFNRYWSRRRDLRPTAGYYGDAGRWLAEMAGDALFERHRPSLVRLR